MSPFVFPNDNVLTPQKKSKLHLVREDESEHRDEEAMLGNNTPAKV